MANQYTKAKEIEARLARQDEAGIPDSPVFSRPAPDEPNRLAGLHFNGTPVEQLPAELVAHLRFEVTDEGLALKDRELQAKREAGLVSRIEMESEAETERKRFGQMGDLLKAGAPPELSCNPLQDLMDEHLSPDEDGRWLDPETVDRLGYRGFVPVKDAEGNKVTCGQSFLAKRSQAAAEASAQRKEQRDQSKLTVLKQQVSEQVGQLAHAEKSAGLPVGATGAPFPAGLRIDREIGSLQPDARVRST